MFSKTTLFTVAIILFSVQITLAQCPTAGTTLSSQAQVNAFPTTYPTCTVIPDGIDIKIMGNDITDLSPLSQLTSVLGAFEIRNCPLLTNLNGLQNITTLGNDPLDGFILRDLPALNSITALSNLNAITGEFTIRTCNSLTSLAGLNNIDTVNGSVIIRDNGTLQNLNGLDSLKYIGETLELVENPQLNDISALSHVNVIVGGPEGGIFIENNTALSNLTGLGNNTTVVGSNLDLTLNGNLSLCAVPTICNYLANPPAGAVITINANLTGCNTQTEILNNCATLGSNENELATTLTLSPNPVIDYLQIKSNDKEEINVEVYDVFGRRLKQSTLKEQARLNLSGYAAGTYFIKITNGSHQTTIRKIIKQ